MASASYLKLKTIFHDIAILEGISSILMWDTEVNMPKGSVDVRVEQINALTAMVYDKITSQETKDLIEEAKFSSIEDEWDRRNLTLIEKKESIIFFV